MVRKVDKPIRAQVGDGVPRRGPSCDHPAVTTTTDRRDAEPFAADGGRVGAVLCHGFTGMPASMRGWGEALAAAGLTVRVPLLPGHGTRWQDANRSTWQEWYAELERSFDDVRSRCDQVFV